MARTFADVATANLPEKKGDHETLYPATPGVGYRFTGGAAPGLCMMQTREEEPRTINVTIGA